VIFQPVLCFGNGRLKGDKAGGHPAQNPYGPGVVRIAPIDCRPKRSGVQDDGSSR
jgi:hypothetical protein